MKCRRVVDDTMAAEVAKKPHGPTKSMNVSSMNVVNMDPIPHEVQEIYQDIQNIHLEVVESGGHITAFFFNLGNIAGRRRHQVPLLLFVTSCLYLFERMPPVNPTPDLLVVRVASTPRFGAGNQLGR